MQYRIGEGQKYFWRWDNSEAEHRSLWINETEWGRAMEIKAAQVDELFCMRAVCLCESLLHSVAFRLTLILFCFSAALCLFMFISHSHICKARVHCLSSKRQTAHILWWMCLADISLIWRVYKVCDLHSPFPFRLFPLHLIIHQVAEWIWVCKDWSQWGRSFTRQPQLWTRTMF